MSLNEKQHAFTLTSARFTVWLSERFGNDYFVIEEECYRPPEQVAAYAKKGVGIKGTLHAKKLAKHLFIFKVVDGKIQWAPREVYEEAGERWKSMHHEHAWGGDFKSRDMVHFSRRHGGVA